MCTTATDSGGGGALREAPVKASGKVARSDYSSQYEAERLACPLSLQGIVKSRLTAFLPEGAKTRGKLCMPFIIIDLHVLTRKENQGVSW